METWRLLPYGQLDGFENMAVDEAIFREAILVDKAPTLRLYGWRRPVVTVGYSQSIDREVNRSFCEKQNIDIVRRPTGGKAVYHAADLTYAVVAPQTRPPFTADIVMTYRAIGRCLIRGLDNVGIKAQLVERGRSSGKDSLEGCCFAVPFRNELLVEGAKICGSAQLRAQGYFLQHGSILIDFDPLMTANVMAGSNRNEEETHYLDRAVTSVKRHAASDLGEEMLVRAICEGFEETMNIRFHEGDLTDRERTLKNELLINKYRTERWNREGAA